MTAATSPPRVLVLVDEPVVDGRWGEYAADYRRAIERAGAVAIPLYYGTGTAGIPQHDGVVAIGGDDIDPALYGEQPSPDLGTTVPERDDVELTVMRDALAHGVPLLAICRGMQLLNVACGGSLLQHIPEDAGHTAHDGTSESSWHSIDVVAGSLLATIAGPEPLLVNSRHHQGVTPERLAPGLRATGVVPSDQLHLIEAIEVPGHPFALGVQWHPERDEMQSDGTPHQLGGGIFDAFVAACAVAAQRRGY